MTLRFSVTQPPQFQMRPEINVPGNIDMAGSVFANYPYLDPNTKGILQLVEDNDYENIERFVEAPDYRNPFQKALDFYRDSPGTRLGIGALLGGPVGALTSLFAPKIFDSVSDGIGSIFGNRMDMDAFNKGMKSAMDDTDPADVGVSSFDAAVAAGIEAAEDDA
tara:strand:- start:424 stop:915 length:492 start_codon:yes stop_codon:yes gene_type:complete